MLRVVARELDAVATALVGEASAREFTALRAASGRSAYPPLRRCANAEQKSGMT